MFRVRWRFRCAWARQVWNVHSYGKPWEQEVFRSPQVSLQLRGLEGGMACEPSSLEEVDETEVQECVPRRGGGITPMSGAGGSRPSETEAVVRPAKAGRIGRRWRQGQVRSRDEGRMVRGECPRVRGDEMVHVRLTFQPGIIQVSTHRQRSVFEDVPEDHDCRSRLW